MGFNSAFKGLNKKNQIILADAMKALIEVSGHFRLWLLYPQKDTPVPI